MKKSARELRRKQVGWYYMMLDTAKEEMKIGAAKLDHKSITHEPLMVALLQQQTGKTCFSNDQLAYLGGSILDATVDTTYSSALTFIKVLGVYSEILKQVQAEVDSICGFNRPPQTQDLATFHYPRACWFEES